MEADGCGCGKEYQRASASRAHTSGAGRWTGDLGIGHVVDPANSIQSREARHGCRRLEIEETMGGAGED